MTFPLRRSTPADPATRSAVVAFALATAALLAGACATGKPHFIESRYEATPAPEGAVVLVVGEPVDARRFTEASNRAPVPSVQGDPSDAALTARVVGRRPASERTLGSNVMLPEGQRVADLVGRAVTDGLSRAGIAADRTPAAGSGQTATVPRLDVTVQAFWLDVKARAPVAIVEYRVRVDVRGDWPRFRDGRTIEAQGTVSAGGLDTVLWRRAFDRALEAIAKRAAEAAGGAGAP